MNHQQKQRGKGRVTPNRAPRNNKIPNSQNAASHNFKMGDDNDYTIYENPYLTHVAMTLLGCTVQVCVKNGNIYEGIFRAVSPKMEITLELAQVLKKEQTEQDQSNKPFCDSLIFAAKDIASITAKNVDLEFAHKKDSFSTDQQISRQFNNGQANERELQPWKPHGDCNEGAPDWLGESNPHMNNGWDVEEMFQKNADKFGVTSSFNTEMPEYTIPLEKSNDKEYLERERRAAEIAREIENSQGYREREEIDSSRTEEEKYAAVVKRNGITNTSGSSDKYIPPALRQGAMRGQTKEPMVINSVRDGSPKPQRVIPAKPVDDHSSVPDTEQAAIRPSSPASSELVAKTDKLKISTSQPAAAVSTFTTVTTVGVTTVTAAVAPISSSAVTVTASAVTTTMANPSSSLPTQVVSPSVSGEKENKETIEELKEFHSNFNYAQEKKLPKKQKEDKETSEQAHSEAEKDLTVVNTSKDPESKSPVTVQEEKQSTNDPSTESILSTSKLNPNAKEFKFNPNAKEFKPYAHQQRHTPPMQSGQQYAIQSQVPISPGPSYSPSISMPQTYPSMLVIGPQVSQTPTGPAFRPQAAKYNVQSRPYGPRDQPGEPGMTGHRVITAAAAAGSPIITPATPPQQLPMMPQATPLYPGVPVPQQVIPQQAPGVNYVPIIPGPSTPPHFMASHSAGMSSSGIPGTPSYTYSFSQDGAPVQMYVAGNVATVPASPVMQGQPQQGPSQQFVFHVPSQMPSPQQVPGPQGGPITGHPTPGAQFIYVGGPQPSPPVGTVPVSSSPLQQQPQYSGRRSGEGRSHGPRAQAFQPRGPVHYTFPQYIGEPRPKPGGS